jgi:uncharacterized membrane protein
LISTQRNLSAMSIYIVALLIGVVAGMRAFVAPAAVSWAARLGLLHVGGTWASFMASVWAVGAFSILTLVEFVTDTLPNTPSRKVAKQLIPRLFSGGFAGAVIGAAAGTTGVVGGLILGVAGAAIGTFVGYEFRSRLVAAIGGKDLPIAILEDVLAVAIAAVALFVVLGAN